MSRLMANKADELLSGTNSNVMADYIASDGEIPGRVVLASSNMCPNPDLTQVDIRGRLAGWLQNAPPAPDTWNVYMTQVTTIGNSSVQKVLDNPAPLLRQNDSPIRMKEHTYQQLGPLAANKSLPDIRVERTTDLVTPADTPRVEVITLSGNSGYPSSISSGWASYCGIIGEHPIESARYTAAAPAVQMGTVAQGNTLLFYVPQDIPSDWTGIAFVVGSSPTTMHVQKRVDLRGKALTQVTDNGPYRTDGRLVDTTTNHTLMGSLGQFNQPPAWQSDSGLNLSAGNYILSYALVTKQGVTADQQINTVSVNNDQAGTSLCWKPPAAAFQQEGIVGWIPKFKGKDGKWYTKSSYAGGIPLSQEARIWSKDTSTDGWKGQQDKPVASNRNTVDRSGVPNPTSAMEIPAAQGASQLPPGRYAVRLTTSDTKNDMESAPGPRVSFTLRDVGAYNGGANNGTASGITDQMVRIYRPLPQIFRNSRLAEVDPNTGKPTLNWEVFTATGATITDGGGFVQFQESDAAITAFSPVRRTPMEPCDPTKYYTLRWRMNVTRYGAGNVRMVVRFLDSTQTQISTVIMEQYQATGDFTEHRVIGPAGGVAQIDFPAGTAYIQAQVNALANRNYDFTVSNIGVWRGRSTPKKVYDLTFSSPPGGLMHNIRNTDVWPVPDEQADTPTLPTTAEIPYEGGPYTRTVTNPTDPARARTVTYLERKGFEDLSLTNAGAFGTGAWTTSVSAGTTLDFAVNAIRGAGTARATSATGALGWGAFIWKDYTLAGRNTFGIETAFRIKALPSAGNVTILGATRAADTATFLSRLRIDSSGNLQWAYYNGTAESTFVTIGDNLQAGDDLRLELVFGGLRTNAGTVTINVKRNERPLATLVTQTSIAWLTGAQNVNRVVVGPSNASAASTALVLMDQINITTTGVSETTALPGSLQQYWAPDGQPAHDPDHMITGLRIPVKPAQQRCFSFYGRYKGITTPTDGAKLFNLAAFDKDGNQITDYGYVASGWLGRQYWDRYYMSYLTPSVAAGDTADAAYIIVTANDIGDGFIEVMAFQDELGSTPTAFVNTNATSGFFQVIFDTSIPGGALAGVANLAFLRARAIDTEITDGSATTSVSLSARGAATKAGLTGAFGPLSGVAVTNRYVEIRVDMTSTSTTKSPEVRAVFLDVQRPQPMLLMQDGRDFDGGVVVYALTPPSPRPNVVRKAYADGSIGQEYVGRGKPPRVLKLSIEAFTDPGKRQVEDNVATAYPLFQVEGMTKRWIVAMAPELNGNTASGNDGTTYWDYIATSLEADVHSEDTL